MFHAVAKIDEKIIDKVTLRLPKEKSRIYCDCVNASKMKITMEPMNFSFKLDEPPGYKYFC